MKVDAMHREPRCLLQSTRAHRRFHTLWIEKNREAVKKTNGPFVSARVTLPAN